MPVQLIGSFESQSIPLPDREAGTEKTIRLIRGLVEQGVKDPRIRRTATDILQSVPAYNDQAEVSEIYHRVLNGIRYTKDMVGVGHGIETLQPAADILISRSGDCDDFVILLASLLGSVGYETRAVTVASNQADPENFSHIYLEALVGGEWIALDAARPDAAFGRAPEMFWKQRRWSLTGGGGMLNGLGDFDWGDFSKTLPDIFQGTAQVIYAGKGIPYNPQIPSGISPYGAGYPGQAYAQVPGGYVSAGGNMNWVWLALGLGALFMFSRRH